MRYKPGDKVKIRADLRPGEDYGGIKPVLSMCMKRGNVATIKSSEVYDCRLFYHIENDECDFLWTEEMFEKIEDKEKGGTAMEYKAGDKVRVRKDLSADNYYGGVYCNSDMARKAGKVVTIKHKALYGRYEIEEDSWHWNKEMFEGIAEEQKTTKYKVGDKVKLRTDLHEDENWCGALVDVTEGMLKWAGKVVTISKVRDNNSYGIREDGGTYLWHESMIQGEVRTCVGVSEGKVDIKTEGNPQNDPVSHPGHYTDGKIEVIDFIQDKHLDFARGNVVKYISRAGKKGGSKEKELEDLKKARQYCDFAIRALEQTMEAK